MRLGTPPWPRSESRESATEQSALGPTLAAGTTYWYRPSVEVPDAGDVRPVNLAVYLFHYFQADQFSSVLGC